MSLMRYISTHSLTKRLTACALASVTPLLFQLTASRRGWQNLFFLHLFREQFQLTASRRGWRCSVYHIEWVLTFQLTASRRGWLLSRLHICTSAYFNSQPHEEADGDAILKIETFLGISTHSLTKRLTLKPLNKIINRFISTHSLTKRLTEDAKC